MNQTLADVASVVRELYKKALASEWVSEAAIAKLYQFDAGTSVRMTSLDSACTSNSHFRRIPAGALDDMDLYGGAAACTAAWPDYPRSADK